MLTKAQKSLQRQRHRAHAQHFLERLQQRYGIIFSEPTDLHRLVALARTAPGTWEGNRKRCWVDWENRRILLIYDKYVDFVVTALQPPKRKR